MGGNKSWEEEGENGLKESLEGKEDWKVKEGRKGKLESKEG